LDGVAERNQQMSFWEKDRADEVLSYLIVIYASPPQLSPIRNVNSAIAYSAWIERGITARKFTTKVGSEVPKT